MTETTEGSLQDLIDATPDLVRYFHDNPRSPHSIGLPGSVPVPPEFTNWRDEQRAWRESVLLFDQSHHMPETFLKGPDAVRLLSDLGINSFASFPPLRAKQYFCCNHEGYIIGEAVLQHLEEGLYEMMSGMHLQNWVEYNARTGGYDVSLTRDLPTAQNPGGRTMYRYQLEGPLAKDVFADAIEGEMPEIPFFHMAKVRIAGCDVYVLRHGMAGHLGVELSGPYAARDIIRGRLLEVGEAHGLVLSGVKTQYSALGESGWLGYPMPAVYTDPKLADYRRSLPDDGWEARSQIGGSFIGASIGDYYVTPWDLNVEKRMKFDHDFVGRRALEKMSGRSDHRRKVTLVWNDDDVMAIHRSLLEGEIPYKFMELPKSSYAFQQYDEVRGLDGDVIGFSNFVGYTVNEAKVLSIAVVDGAHAEPGTQVSVTWGEPNGGSAKPGVETHRQTTVRAVVAPNPYAAHAQRGKNAAMVR